MDQTFVAGVESPTKPGYYEWGDPENWEPYGVPNLPHPWSDPEWYAQTDEADNVIFSNSSPNCDLSTVATHVCYDFNSSGYTGDFWYSNSFTTIQIRGTSCILGSGMTSSCGTVDVGFRFQFDNTSAATLLTNGVELHLLNCIGVGAVTVSDDLKLRQDISASLTIGSLWDPSCSVTVNGNIYGGNITVANAGSLTASNIYFFSEEATGSAYAKDTSNINCNNIIINGYSVTLRSDNATLNIADKLTYENNGGPLYLRDNINLPDFEIDPGSSVRLYVGSNIAVLGRFDAVGTSDDPITFRTPTLDTGDAFFSVTTLGQVKYVEATDIDSSGGVEIVDWNGTLLRTINWRVPGGGESSVSSVSSSSHSSIVASSSSSSSQSSGSSSSSSSDVVRGYAFIIN